MPCVDGNRYEKYFQKSGILALGQEKPPRKSKISVQKRKEIRPVSLFFTNTDTLIEKKMVAMRNGTTMWKSVHIEPMCGKLNHLGISTRIYALSKKYRIK